MSKGINVAVYRQPLHLLIIIKMEIIGVGGGKKEFISFSQQLAVEWLSRDEKYEFIIERAS